MITISETHYSKLVQIVELFHQNLGLITPSHTNLEEAYQKWKEVNEDLSLLYKKLDRDLGSILSNNSSLKNQKQEIQEQLSQMKNQNANLLKTNTIQRAELAKNQADFNKLKEITKGFKTTLKEKEKDLQEKSQYATELEEKVKKYKKLYHEQVKKVQKLDKIVTVLEVTQKSSAKEKQLDDQMEFLQTELQNLQRDNE